MFEKAYFDLLTYPTAIREQHEDRPENSKFWAYLPKFKSRNQAKTRKAKYIENSKFKNVEIACHVPFLEIAAPHLSNSVRK